MLSFTEKGLFLSSGSSQVMDERDVRTVRSLVAGSGRDSGPYRREGFTLPAQVQDGLEDVPLQETGNAVLSSL